MGGVSADSTVGASGALICDISMEDFQMAPRDAANVARFNALRVLRGRKLRARSLTELRNVEYANATIVGIWGKLGRGPASSTRRGGPFWTPTQ